MITNMLTILDALLDSWFIILVFVIAWGGALIVGCLEPRVEQ